MMRFFSITPAVILMLQILGCLAQNRTTEADEAAIKDPKIECSPYTYPPLAEQSALFPTSWKPAKIVSGDTAAEARWQSIASNIPDIPPKTTGSQYGADDNDCWWTQTGCLTPKLAGIPPDIADVPEPFTLGYGFDDGPNCSHNAFYDYLASKNQKATMFFIGSNILVWPLETQRALTDGHEICVHTWSHTAMTSLSSPDAFAELYYTASPLSVGSHLLLIRVSDANYQARGWCDANVLAGPPYGDVDDRIRALANALGLRTIMWKYDTGDWKIGANGVGKAQVDANYQGFIDQATSGAFSSNGAIILAHETDNSTMQEAVDYYDRLHMAFKYIVPVAVALNKTQPYVETNYIMPTFEQYINNVTVTTNDRTGPDPSPTDEPARPQPSVRNAAPAGCSFMNILGIISPITLCLLIY